MDGGRIFRSIGCRRRRRGRFCRRCKRGEVIGVFGIFVYYNRRGLGNIAEFSVSKHVAIGVGADGIISVIGAIKGDFGEEIGSGLQSVAELIADLEKVRKIRTFGGVIDKGQRLRFGVANEFLIAVRIRLVFDFAIIGGVGKQFDVIAFREQKQTAVGAGRAVEKGAARLQAGIIAYAGQRRLYGGRLRVYRKRTDGRVCEGVRGEKYVCEAEKQR